MINKGCQEYLCTILDDSSLEVTLEDILVVREFSNIFPDDLPNVLIDREIEFTIDLILNTQLISKTPYCMAPVELAELKTQLQELLDKGFIRPSTSNWGAPVVLVKKRMEL